MSRECSDSDGEFMYSSLPQRHIWEEAVERLSATGWGGPEQNSVSQTRQISYTGDFTAALTPAQDLHKIKPLKIPALMGEEHTSRPLEEELLTLDGRDEREGPSPPQKFSFEVLPLVG